MNPCFQLHSLLSMTPQISIILKGVLRRLWHTHMIFFRTAFEQRDYKAVKCLDQKSFITCHIHHSHISVELVRFCFGRFLFVSLLVFYCFGIICKDRCQPEPFPLLRSSFRIDSSGGNFHSVKSGPIFGRHGSL